MKNYIFVLWIIIFMTNNYAQDEHYRKNAQEIPKIWKKLLRKKARIYLLPGGKLPGYFDRRMTWFHMEKGLSQKDIKEKKAFIVFNTFGPNVEYIDLNHLKYIFHKNKSWDTYDLVKMLKLSGGRIFFDKNYSPVLYIGNKKFKYKLPRWKVRKLYLLIAKVIQQKIFVKESPEFHEYLKKVTAQQYTYPYEDMDEEKFFFILHSINQAYAVFQKKYESLPISQVSAKSIEMNPIYSFSLIPFKKGDLDKHSSYLLERGIQKGFTKVALFFPVYYSGASTRHRKMERINGKIVHGKHYFYEDIFAIDKPELKRCLNSVWKSGLSFTFVPHLENIHTLNRIWESSWRIHSEIPLDDHYFKRSFETLFSSIRENKDIIRPDQEIRIVVASEIDPSFITEAETSYELIKTLRREIKLCGLKDKQIKLVWNPNGDFLHGWHEKQNAPDYDILVKIFENLDSIAPSMYERHNHIVYGSYKKSRDKFSYLLITMFHKLFAGRNIRKLVDEVDRIIESDFSLGEFGLKDSDSRTNYIDFHKEFKEYNPNGIAILWCIDKWDHANITGDCPGAYEKEFEKVLKKSP